MSWYFLNQPRRHSSAWLEHRQARLQKLRACWFAVQVVMAGQKPARSAHCFGPQQIRQVPGKKSLESRPFCAYGVLQKGMSLGGALSVLQPATLIKRFVSVN